MSLIDLQARLSRLLATEQEILEKGQKTVDEDEQEVQRANLKQVQDSIERLQEQIGKLKSPSMRRTTRQYRAIV